MGQKRVTQPDRGTVGRRGVTRFYHAITLTTSGTIGSQDSVQISGISAVKTAAKTGRYTLTLPDAFKTFLGGFVTLIGVTDASFGAITTGNKWFFRNNNIDGGTKAGTIDVQFATNDGTNITDAELPTNTVIKLELALEWGT